ncbi:MAG: hypothetical protein ACF8PN_08260 [Phycisphaerales bacterium]
MRRTPSTATRTTNPTRSRRAVRPGPRFLTATIAALSMNAAACGSLHVQLDGERRVATTSSATSRAAVKAAAADSTWTTLRVGGDLTAAVEQRGDEYVYPAGAGWFGVECETSLDWLVGCPAPTPPGAIELKRYPSFREASITSRSPITEMKARGVKPLRAHLKRHDVEIRVPLVIEFEGVDTATGDGLERWRMGVWYPNRTDGPVGIEGPIIIEDTAPVTMLSLGRRGPYEPEPVLENLRELEDWLAAHPEWVVVGPPRILGYSTSFTADRKRWSETQIPVARADETGAGQMAEVATDAP